MQVKLIVLQGTNAGKEFVIPTPQFLIGRADQCHLRPRSDAIGWRHCALVSDGRQVVLHDFQSESGTYVNEQRVEGRITLNSGDVLRVGPLAFQVDIDGDSGGADRLAAYEEGGAPERPASVVPTANAQARPADSAAVPAENDAPPSKSRWKRWLGLAKEESPKKEPGKLPTQPKFVETSDSGEAAAEMLRRFFQKR
jgi:pSer/pThr/pTyr-binding forkhead associated (FHA) protein